MREQEPTLSKSDRTMGQEYEHPAYGTISCSRASGVTALVGSELTHNHYVSLRIHRSRKVRHLHEDRFHASINPIVEINLSEHQWASFVASMNLGNGVPCTITRGPTEDAIIESKASLKEPNKHKMAQTELQVEAKALTDRMQSELDGLKELANSPGPISKTALRDRIGALYGAVMGVCSNLPFHVEQHKEMMEKNLQAAKSDVEGFVTGMVTTLGLQAIRETAPQIGMERLLENKGDAA